MKSFLRAASLLLALAIPTAAMAAGPMTTGGECCPSCPGCPDCTK